MVVLGCGSLWTGALKNTRYVSICMLLFFPLSIYTAHLYVQVINLFRNYDAGVTTQYNIYIYICWIITVKGSY